MRIATCFILLIFLIVSIDSAAQKFMQSAGFAFIRGVSNNTPQNGGTVKKMAINGVTYFPRFNLAEKSNSSLSLGLPVTFGFKGAAGSGGSSIAAGINAPLVLDYNFAHQSSPGNSSPAGGYIGAGFGYTLVSMSETSSFGTYSANTKSYGPVIRAGMRFGIPTGRESLSFTLGGFYKHGLETDKFKTGGGSLMMNF